MTYKQLIEVANDLIKRCTAKSDTVIHEIEDKIESLSMDQIRDYMLKISLISYNFSEIKEKSAFKATCAEMLRKEKYATEYSVTDGTVAQRESTALLNSSEQMVVEEIYNLTANVLKTKLDECHRVVDTLKSILMSKMSEAKLMNISSTAEIPSTTNGIINLDNI